MPLSQVVGGIRWPHFFQGRQFDMSQEATGVKYKMNDGWIPFSCFSFDALALCMLAHCHGLLGHLNRTEPLLIFLVTPVLFLL